MVTGPADRVRLGVSALGADVSSPAHAVRSKQAANSKTGLGKDLTIAGTSG
jgi:hypothetical protein